MQRRNPLAVKGQGGGALPSSTESARIGRPAGGSVSSLTKGWSPWVLIVVAALLTIATFMVPDASNGRASQASKDKMMAANERMLKQESKWVDGEKKLKQKLKVLMERQQEGKDLGVPVATRWVGDDIPAWAGEGVDVEDWKAKIKARYDTMRQDEVQWREMVAAELKTMNRG